MLNNAPRPNPKIQRIDCTWLLTLGDPYGSSPQYHEASAIKIAQLPFSPRNSRYE